MTSRDCSLSFYTRVSSSGCRCWRFSSWGACSRSSDGCRKWVTQFSSPRSPLLLQQAASFPGRNLGLADVLDRDFSLMAQAAGARNLLRGITVAIVAVCSAELQLTGYRPTKGEATEHCCLLHSCRSLLRMWCLVPRSALKPVFVHNLFYPLIIVLAV